MHTQFVFCPIFQFIYLQILFSAKIPNFFLNYKQRNHQHSCDCRFMPFLILSGQLCPPGIEGTLFALFMSINNFGSTVSSFVGAGLASILNISSGNFDNLLIGILIQVVCTFIPITCLSLIPKEATGISA